MNTQVRWRCGALIAAAFLVLAGIASAAEFTFDAAEFAKKPLEWSGYVEYRHDYFRLNRDGAFYALSFRNGDQPRTLNRDAATLKLAGRYTRGVTGVRTRAHLEYAKDDFSSGRTARFDEPVSESSREPRGASNTTVTSAVVAVGRVALATSPPCATSNAPLSSAQPLPSTWNRYIPVGRLPSAALLAPCRSTSPHAGTG